ncbi:Biotin synthase [Trichinella spiralis]|uniref:Biotin synthase n=1 Tax=Trichinella spiralis TaxID=6334 RepID=A0ABR3K6C0_TRISP
MIFFQVYISLSLIDYDTSAPDHPKRGSTVAGGVLWTDFHCLVLLVTRSRTNVGRIAGTRFCRQHSGPPSDLWIALHGRSRVESEIAFFSEEVGSRQKALGQVAGRSSVHQQKDLADAGLTAANADYQVAVRRIKKRKDAALTAADCLITVARELLPEQTRIKWDELTMEDELAQSDLS